MTDSKGMWQSTWNIEVCNGSNRFLPIFRSGTITIFDCLKCFNLVNKMAPVTLHVAFIDNLGLKDLSNQHS